MKTRLSLAIAVAALSFAQAQDKPVLSVTGDIVAPLSPTDANLSRMPHENGGVPLREILKKAGLTMDRIRGKALAGYILAKGHDGYQVAFALGELAPDLGNTAISVGKD
jgi:hypothetical protein